MGTKYADLIAHRKHLLQRAFLIPPEKDGLILGMSASPSCRFMSVLDNGPNKSVVMGQRQRLAQAPSDPCYFLLCLMCEARKSANLLEQAYYNKHLPFLLGQKLVLTGIDISYKHKSAVCSI